MKKLLLLPILTLLAAFAAIAHPLGNFSVNQFSGIEAANGKINLRQILDMAEIPSYQAAAEIDIDKDGKFSKDEADGYAEKLGQKIKENLLLSINGEPLALQLEKKKAELREGSGNLPILRIEWDFSADIPKGASGKITFENQNFKERIGWNEIVISRAEGINIFDSNAFGNSLSNELKSYPENLLNAPLNERSAEFSFATGAIAANSKPLQNRDGNAAASISKDRLAELITIPELTPGVILFGLLLAFGLGAMHALSPGHGKTVVGAYLVGSRGTLRHALFLGMTVTITHTLGVFALGLITLFASNYILPEKLMPFLNFISGLLVFFIGLTLFKERLFRALKWKGIAHDHHHGDNKGQGHHSHEQGEHEHDGHTHTHDGHTHSHLPPEKLTWRNLLALGISGGLLPCPSALVLMLSAISLGRIGYGLILTTLFSLGLASTLTAIGLIFLYLGKAFGESRLGSYGILKALPVMSAFVIACFGAAICYNSFS